MHRIFTGLVLIICAGSPSAAPANDGAAERAAGGLVFVHNDDVDMVSEDLFISLAEVRVRYLFRNRTARDVRLTVAFPMPDWDLAEPVEGDVVWPSGFATRVDGRPVRTEVEFRAMLGGVDHSALLRRLGVPILSRLDPQAETTTYRGLADLPPATVSRLIEAGLVRRASEENGRPLLEPLWTLRETWHWDQVFPAGRDLVVEHRYRPGAGGIVSTALASPDYRQSEDGRAWIERFCIDSDFLGAVDRIARRRGSEYPTIPEHWVSYILTTGAGWRSPIGEFRLVVDKGEPQNLVSFCGEGVRRIGPTQFEMRRRNWRPDRNLDVLFLRP
ncbi:MAG: DUF4424 domain-containing protein [Allosphingosinicella sp.]